MAPDDSDIRALVGHRSTAAEARPRRRPSRQQLLRIIGITTATLVVASSVGFAGYLLARELTANEPDLRTVASSATEPGLPDGTAPSVAPTAEPSVSVLPVKSGVGFDNLRHLPAGAVSGLMLQATLPLPDATPLAAYTRTSASGTLTGMVFLDLSESDFIDGIGVHPPRETSINGTNALIAAAGPASSHVAQWTDPTFGKMRAWGFGLAEVEHARIVDAIISTFDDPDAAPPTGWETVDGYQLAFPGPVWRAHYLGAEGEIAIIAASYGPGPVADCLTAACISSRAFANEDGVEVAAFASERRVDALSASLRPVSKNNARIRNFEIEPLAAADLSAARSLLYVPAVDSEWQVVELLAHTSGEGATEPALVLTEREIPEIGRITSAVVAQILPAGASETLGETDGSITRIVVESGGLLIQVVGWEHTLEELLLVHRLVSVDDDGFSYASRAASSVGLDRAYETIAVTPFPQTIMEGAVFGARVRSNSGSNATIRVSVVPSFSADAETTTRHENERVTVKLRGQSAAAIVDGGQATLTWEERPGVLIHLVGSDSEELLGLARSLELVDVSDLVAPNAS